MFVGIFWWAYLRGGRIRGKKACVREKVGLSAAILMRRGLIGGEIR